MKDLDTKDAGRYKWAAAADADRRNAKNKRLYSQDQIRKALMVQDLIDTAFKYDNLYINYRQKFIAIKAEAARAKDALAQTVIKCFEANGYGVVRTAQGIIVQIDRL